MFKVCGKCKEEKSIDYFSFRSKIKGIRQSNCKDCQKQYCKQHFKDNVGYYRNKARDTKRRSRETLNKYKETLCCSRCPENDISCLDFHHLNPDEKEKSISQAVASGWSFKRLELELNKCIVLCSNCHRKEHAALSSSG
jgi:hypothetical protein